mmetsp:Transcript_68843/g.165256  ORF Transcript_68843/g.165256 Transcript_68843/m.165256 type:complete len:499 (+) Transcript_68843:63-1559(+)
MFSNCLCGCFPFLGSATSPGLKRSYTEGAIKNAGNLAFYIPHALDENPEDYFLMGDASGSGGFGAVRRVECKKTGNRCVMKTMLKESIPSVEMFQNEVGIQAELDHPNIARLNEIFEDQKCVYIVMHAADGGDLFDYLEQRNTLSGHDGKIVMRQLLAAVVYLHEACIVHRDIKLENLMLDRRGVTLDFAVLKLIDFGFAKRFQPGVNSLSTMCGTPWYMAPEILSGDYNEKCDVYSCGVLLYLALSGSMPFDDHDPHAVLQKAASEKLTFEKPGFKSVKPMAKVLLAELLNKNVPRRPSARAALDHQWVQDEGSPQSLCTASATEAVQNLTRFRRQNTFKKKAMMVVAHYMDTSTVTNMKECFEAIDKDHSGRLKPAELDVALAQTGLPPEQQEDLRKQLQEYAASGDILYSEFIAASLVGSKELQKVACWEAFRVFDTDGNGVIDIAELKVGLQAGSRLREALSDSDVERIYDQVHGHDGSGITFDEFMQMLQGDA